MSARCAPASSQAAWHIHAVQEAGWSCGVWEMSRVCRDGVATSRQARQRRPFPWVIPPQLVLSQAGGKGS